MCFIPYCPRFVTRRRGSIYGVAVFTAMAHVLGCSDQRTLPDTGALPREVQQLAWVDNAEPLDRSAVLDSPFTH
jgi:hypothetical protein